MRTFVVGVLVGSILLSAACSRVADPAAAPVAPTAAAGADPAAEFAFSPASASAPARQPAFASPSDAGRPKPNPFLASSLFAITHFDSSASDAMPYGPPRGAFRVDLAKAKILPGGPTNILTLASTDPDFMWHVGADRVEYVRVRDGELAPVARYEALAIVSGGALPALPDAALRAVGDASVRGGNVESIDALLEQHLGEGYARRFGNGTYTLVDERNVLYVNYAGTLLGLTLKDPARPEAGIEVRYRLPDLVRAIQGRPGAHVIGFAMTYDGHLVVTFTNGIAVIDRDLRLSTREFHAFTREGVLGNEIVTNSIAIDERNGIYVASNVLMRKLVWTGSKISALERDGAWSAPYDDSGAEIPPIVKAMNGTGSTPTLMGFGDDADRLVVLTDGAKRMKLVAFWRDAIPAGAAGRVAGRIQVTCGFETPPEWLQSEQSVVVNGWGAFVINNIPRDVPPALAKIENPLLKILAMGPAYPTAYGVERFRWDPSRHAWSSAWARPDVSSTSMVPAYAEAGNMALVNGYRDGWEILGLDWETGETVHAARFGDANWGNGAYALIQYLENGDLLFNTFAGVLRVPFDESARVGAGDQGAAPTGP